MCIGKCKYVIVFNTINETSKLGVTISSKYRIKIGMEIPLSLAKKNTLYVIEISLLIRKALDKICITNLID